MNVINHGVTSGAQAVFELATEIADQLSDLSKTLENIQEAIAKLTDLQPVPSMGRLKFYVALRTFAGINPTLGNPGCRLGIRPVSIFQLRR